jgi:hypothetical protein
MRLFPSEKIPPAASTAREPLAVIGAGLAGSLSAVYLASAGYDVILIEAKEQLMYGTSKIPVHLHSGGLYIKPKKTAASSSSSATSSSSSEGSDSSSLDMNDAFDCLRDSINYILGLPFTLSKRPTAFAIMATENIASIVSDSETSIVWQAVDQTRQEFEFNLMIKGFESLRQKYQELLQKLSVENQSKVLAILGSPNDFFRIYSKDEFIKLKVDVAAKPLLGEDPDLFDKEAWVRELARVTDPETICGVILSSEVGINMFRARAGIKLAIDRLEKEEKITVLFNNHINLSNVKKDDTSYVLTVIIDGKPQDFRVSQIVNATGYASKNLDRVVDQKLPWSVDIKGDMLRHIPEVYFTKANGMCHFARFNDRVAGVNFTTPYVEATYVKDGKKTFKENEPVVLDEQLQRFLASSSIDKDLLKRTERCIDGCSKFMPQLKTSVEPTGYFSGALGLLGNDLASRASKGVYLKDHEQGYHAINIIKGGGVVTAVMDVVNSALSCSALRFPLKTGDISMTFRGRDTDPIPPEFMLEFNEENLQTSLEDTVAGLNIDGNQFRATF